MAVVDADTFRVLPRSLSVSILIFLDQFFIACFDHLETIISEFKLGELFLYLVTKFEIIMEFDLSLCSFVKYLSAFDNVLLLKFLTKTINNIVSNFCFLIDFIKSIAQISERVLLFRLIPKVTCIAKNIIKQMFALGKILLRLVYEVLD